MARFGYVAPPSFVTPVHRHCGTRCGEAHRFPSSRRVWKLHFLIRFPILHLAEDRPRSSGVLRIVEPSPDGGSGLPSQLNGSDSPHLPRAGNLHRGRRRPPSRGVERGAARPPAHCHMYLSTSVVLPPLTAPSSSCPTGNRACCFGRDDRGGAATSSILHCGSGALRDHASTSPAR